MTRYISRGHYSQFRILSTGQDFDSNNFLLLNVILQLIKKNKFFQLDGSPQASIQAEPLQGMGA
jgi:hypothetical protein